MYADLVNCKSISVSFVVFDDSCLRLLCFSPRVFGVDALTNPAFTCDDVTKS